MDYGTQHQQQVAQQGQQQTTTPATVQQQTTTVPVEGQQTTTPAAETDQLLTLDDLFPSDDKGKQTTTPATQTQPTQQTTPNENATDEEKLKLELDQRLKESEQKLNQNLNTTVDQIQNKIERNNQLSNFFQNPDNEPFRKYQDTIIKVATDPRYVGMKIERVLPMALGMGTMMKIGAELATNRNTKAAGNSTGGFQNGTQRVMQTTAGPDYSKMTNEEFEARTQAVMRGERAN